MTQSSFHKPSINNSRYKRWICFFLAAAILLLYSPVINFEFVNYDDDDYVYNNPNVLKGLTLKSVKWAFTTFYASNWHPITWLSLMADIQLYGVNPGAIHLTNLLFHILNSLLLFLIFTRMTGEIWKSSVIAALFAFHPLHVESVAWISERKDLLSSFFWMLTLWSYLRYIEYPGIKRYILILIFFMLGLMAKPMVITLPCVLLLIDYWLRSQKSEVRSKLTANSQDPTANSQQPAITSYLSPITYHLFPLFLLSAISGIITVMAQQSGGAVRTLQTYPLHIRIGNVLLSYVEYIEKMFVPYKMAIFYPPRIATWQQASGAALFLIAVSLLAIWHIRKHPYLIVGWLWYLGTLVPVIGLVQVGSQAIADRYTYIPLIGLFIMLVWSIPELFSQWKDKKWYQILCFTFIISIFCVLMAITSRQIEHWRNSVTLFSHALEVTEKNMLAHTNLGLALVHQGNIDQGIYHYQKALQIEPDNSTIHNNMGTALFYKGKSREAILHFQKALEKKPNDPDLLYNLNRVLSVQKEKEKEFAEIRNALESTPQSAELHYQMGNLYRKYQEIDNAIQCYQNALSIQPDFPEVLSNLGILYAVKGEYDTALSLFKKAIAIQPENADIYYYITGIYSMQDQREDAVNWLKKAVEKGFDNWKRLKTDKNLENIRETSYYKEMIKK